MMTEYTKTLIRDIKLVGAELVQRAEEFAGDSELVTDFTIWLRFPADTSFPEIEVQKSVVSQKVLMDVKSRCDRGRGEGDDD